METQSLWEARWSRLPTRRYRPPPEESVIESGCPNVDLSENRFAYLTSDCQTSYNGLVPLGLDVPNPVPPLQEPVFGLNGRISPHHFNYPGDTPSVWNGTYFGTGDKAGSNFPNTAYVHIYKTTNHSYQDSITVIQYFYFYPYNHWWNRHEGDWPRVSVVVSSRDSLTAQAIGVEYLFHKAHLSYYNDYTIRYKRNSLGQNVAVEDECPSCFETPATKLASNFVFDPQREVRLSQGTHPVIYVGAGSHGSYPFGGKVPIHEGGDSGGLYEWMTHTGLVLATEAGSHHLWENYDLVILPEPSPGSTNLALADSMSWLGADILWGTPIVDSPYSNPLAGVPILGIIAGQQGNDSPARSTSCGLGRPEIIRTRLYRREILDP